MQLQWMNIARTELVKEFCELVQVDSEPYEEADLGKVVEDKLLELGLRWNAMAQARR